METIDKYIGQQTPEIQNVLKEIRAIIRSAAPDAAESISWKMPTYKLEGKPLVYFAAHKNHVGFYPIPSGISAFADELKSYKNSGKGTIQFPYSKPLPVNLIRRIVEFRVQEITGK
ncbi:MAG: DUF1801 domain-containing protein [Paludibacter sp.]|jgi:uncharacterized protein YdhG (YjbR/CyaY superfamily)|nr:DUF1801 domain-containing protein [Paludibacter sp.]